MIQLGDFAGAQPVSRGQLLRSAAQYIAQLQQSKAGRFTMRKRRQHPMFLEGRQPLRVTQVVGTLAKSVPLFAVCQVNPGSSLSESVCIEDILWRFHGNDLNSLDSLHWIDYLLVMSVAALKHYINRRYAETFRTFAAAHR